MILIYLPFLGHADALGEALPLEVADGIVIGIRKEILDPYPTKGTHMCKISIMANAKMVNVKCNSLSF